MSIISEFLSEQNAKRIEEIILDGLENYPDSKDFIKKHLVPFYRDECENGYFIPHHLINKEFPDEMNK